MPPLPDGHVSISFTGVKFKRGSNFSIRQICRVPLSVFEVLEFGTFKLRDVSLSFAGIGNGMNAFVSEKRIRQNDIAECLDVFIPPLAKIITDRRYRNCKYRTKLDPGSGAVQQSRRQRRRDHYVRPAESRCGRGRMNYDR